MIDEIALRNLHESPAPSWWPPAPGWWVMLAVVIAALAMWHAWRQRQHRRVARLLDVFDAAVRAAQSPQQRLAVVSELLRRAARRIDPAADRLEGKAWLRMLDLGEDGRLLLDGPFRADVPSAAVDALLPRARQRFLHWMQAT